MEASREPWAIVLAAGEGKRLRALTTDLRGRSIPKQFCSLDGGASLLQMAFRRAARVAPWRRIGAVVAADHEHWWRAETERLPDTNVVVQPTDRGTAIGVLTPLLRIYAVDPEAEVVLLPSDHFVADESRLAKVLEQAVTHVSRRPESAVLLGIEPDQPETGFGWIVPATDGGEGPRAVRRFVEKPAAAVAAELMRDGGLWNSFILAASARTLLDLFDRRLPREVAVLWAALSRDLGVAQRPEDLSHVYAGLARHDFCGEVLEGAEDLLCVLPVPPCGWSDLGTPQRLSRCIEQLPPAPATARGVVPGLPNLALSTERSRAASVTSGF